MTHSQKGDLVHDPEIEKTAKYLRKKTCLQRQAGHLQSPRINIGLELVESKVQTKKQWQKRTKATTTIRTFGKSCYQ